MKLAAEEEDESLELSLFLVYVGERKADACISPTLGIAKFG